MKASFRALVLSASLFSLPFAALADVTLWAVDDMVRINPETGKAFEDNPKQLPGGISGDYRVENAVWSAQDQTVRLDAARNEVVAFQIIIEGEAAKVTVVAATMQGPGETSIPAWQFKLFREWYIRIGEKAGDTADKACMAPLGAGWYPDVAIPLTEARFGNGFSLPSKDFHTPDGSQTPRQQNQAVWVDLFVPMSTKAGLYTGKINVTADGAVHSVNIRLNVWNFAIPNTMNMHAELMNYGQTAGEPDPEVMYRYFRLAQEHRTFISDDKARPAYNGNDYDWTEFDQRFGPLFTGAALTDGPCARQPIPNWTFPINYQIERPDKENKKNGPDWPIPAPKTEDKLGVDFTPQFKKDLSRAMTAWEAHFVRNNWVSTRQAIFQNSLDEPGFHKSGTGLEAGRKQAAAIHETAKLVKDNGLKLVFYKLDIGGGNTGNLLDLDGNGKVEGAKDVAGYFGPLAGLFSIHGLCVDMDALEPYTRGFGVKVIFYNGYHPRVGPNTIPGELLGFRTWAVAAWRSGLSGWADWQFRRETGRQVFFEPNDDTGRTLYMYRGDAIGLEGRVFASLRMKSMRRGAQDYEMLRLLAAKDHSDRRAQNVAAMVCGAGFRDLKLDLASFRNDVPGVDKPYAGVDANAHWSHNPAAWVRFHKVLGDAIASGI